MDTLRGGKVVLHIPSQHAGTPVASDTVLADSEATPAPGTGGEDA
jgi:hypothetical protein